MPHQTNFHVKCPVLLQLRSRESAFGNHAVPAGRSLPGCLIITPGLHCCRQMQRLSDRLRPPSTSLLGTGASWTMPSHALPQPGAPSVSPCMQDSEAQGALPAAQTDPLRPDLGCVRASHLTILICKEVLLLNDSASPCPTAPCELARGMDTGVLTQSGTHCVRPCELGKWMRGALPTAQIAPPSWIQAGQKRFLALRHRAGPCHQLQRRLQQIPWEAQMLVLAQGWKGRHHAILMLRPLARRLLDLMQAQAGTKALLLPSEHACLYDQTPSLGCSTRFWPSVLTSCVGVVSIAHAIP